MKGFIAYERNFGPSSICLGEDHCGENNLKEYIIFFYLLIFMCSTLIFLCALHFLCSTFLLRALEHILNGAFELIFIT